MTTTQTLDAAPTLDELMTVFPSIYREWVAERMEMAGGWFVLATNISNKENDLRERLALLRRRARIAGSSAALDRRHAREEIAEIVPKLEIIMRIRLRQWA